MEDPNLTTDAGNGNEPQMNTTLTTDAGNGNESPLAAVAPEPSVIDGGLNATSENTIGTAALEVALQQPQSDHPAHGWLDALMEEFHALDEVMLNRLHHIVAKIRETL